MIRTSLENRRSFLGQVALGAFGLMVGSKNILGQEPLSKKSDKLGLKLSGDEVAALKRILHKAEIWPKSLAVFEKARLSTNGLYLDRLSPTSTNEAAQTVSLAATGFGLAVDVLMAQKSMFGNLEKINKAVVQKRLFQALETVEKLSKPENGYFLPHFVHGKTLENQAEISTVDTMIFYLGALASAEYCGAEAVQNVTRMMNRLDFEAMRTRGKTMGQGNPYQNANHFSHGLTIDSLTGKPSYIPHHWGGPYSEGVLLLNLMSLGSPQNVPQSVYTEGWEASQKWQDSKTQPPLFTYFYPFCFLPLQNKVDAQGNDFLERSQQSIAFQKQFCQAQKYPGNLFGLTACDAPPPAGYKAYAAQEGEHDGTISPPAILASLALHPKAAFEALQDLEKMRAFQSPFGIVNAVNVFSGWKSDDALLIDMGSMLLLLAQFEKENLTQDEQNNKNSQPSISQLLGETDWVQKAFQRAGFKAKL